MAHRLEAVAVRVEHERSVVAGMVVWSQAGRAIAAAARGERGAEERVNRRPVGSLERDVLAVGRDGRRAGLPAGADPEGGLGPVIRTVAGANEVGRIGNLHHHLVAERAQRLIVERARAGIIGDG